VSVIVRTRHRPELLRIALRDIAAQSHPATEVLIVSDADDVSQVEAVVEEAAGLALTIRVIDRAGELHGRSQAANAGLRAARGEFVVLHDDDDTWDPSFLTRTVSFLCDNPESVAVSAHTAVIVHRTDPSGVEHVEELLLNPALTSITITDMVRANRITTNSLLYRKSVHDEIGYIDESLTVHEDWDFYLRLIARHPIDLLPLPALAFWHHRPEAQGDQANSVFALGPEHEAAHALVRDDQLRDTIQRQGWGGVFHLVEELQRLETSRKEDLREFALLHDRLDEMTRRIEDLAATEARIQDSFSRLSALLVHRTSLSARIRSTLRRIRP
jgi:glycosyltransferase involved in cell wall biosynthesis